MEIYNKLLSSYGYQGWWPVTPTASCQELLKPCYGITIKTTKQRFEIIVGAILTQNTSWKNVEKAIIELNKKGFIDVKKIANAKKEELATLIKSSGYYNQKAERLKLIASFILKNPIKKLMQLEDDKLRELLLSLKGIGNETADSIMLYALDKPVFVVDAYTRRIASRIGIINGNESYSEIQSLFHSSLEKDRSLYNEYHALIVRHAKEHCKKKESCERCCLHEVCMLYKANKLKNK